MLEHKISRTRAKVNLLKQRRFGALSLDFGQIVAQQPCTHEPIFPEIPLLVSEQQAFGA